MTTNSIKSIFFIIALTFFYSCDDITEVEDISDDIVTVLAPTDQAVLTTLEVNFSWNSIEEADQYRLQVATPTFEAATQVVLDTTIVIANFTQTLDLGSYQWRVRAENSEYNTSYTTQSFTVEE